MEITLVSKEADKLYVSGETLWGENVEFKKGDILTSDNHKWAVVRVDRIFQGCFGVPMWRRHNLILEPIGHGESLKVGQVLVK